MLIQAACQPTPAAFNGLWRGLPSASRAKPPRFL
jgi:hypothetical protein